MPCRMRRGESFFDRPSRVAPTRPKQSSTSYRRTVRVRMWRPRTCGRKKEKKNSGRKPRSECSDRHMRRRAEETREGEGAARVGRDGGSRGGRDQRERRVCGVRMIDNGRYKVDSVRSGRPMRKMVHCQFFVVSDSTDRPKGESASQKWWRVIQAADGRRRGERWEGTDALPCGAP